MKMWAGAFGKNVRFVTPATLGFQTPNHHGWHGCVSSRRRCLDFNIRVIRAIRG
jgi:hypothetical protein